MEKVENGKVLEKKEEDVNGNRPVSKVAAKKKGNGARSLVKDQITTSDGRVFYPCRFCNKVFPIRKTRTAHTRKCPAKEYILSVGEGPVQEDVPKEEAAKQPNIPVNKPASKKIDIQQNIILNKQPQMEESLQPKSPIKLTIRRSPSNGSNVTNHFTVSNNSLVLKEKNESNDDFISIAKRLESNSVTIIKQPKEDNNKSDNKTESVETTCRECTKEFGSPLELLRHSRKCHSYPKVMMALSEVKKFYSTKDRSECPICHKPLKTNFRSAFVKHLHTHTNEMKYSCHVCNKKFRRSDHMKAHEKRHITKNGK